MKIKAQIAMVMNLDKCIGCHTCSITCKTAWTNRPGAEYMWFNNVETKPGIGYPKKWEDQDIYKGGWELRKGKLELKSGTKLSKMAFGKIFYNPDMPEIKDFYEPWTYDYETLTNTSEVNHSPVAKAKSVITGEPMDLEWGPNWEDDLAGGTTIAPQDPNLKKIEEDIKFSFEQAFMVYLPRICEHCLNPGCVASCPSGAMYKRDEDGIVLVDQESCRGWRYCTTGCPYKKVYFNWKTNKAEKCTFCYPRIESGTPTICSETCVGRLRYLGVLLYDADKVLEAASVKDEKDLYEAHCDLFLDPNDPEVIKQARKDGISEDWIEGAQKSPIYKLAIEYKLAFPLHPEYRTLPMVWYVPPLSPIMNYFEGKDSINNPDMIFPAIEEMRVPMEYLANLLTAGDVQPVKEALQKMAMMRMYMRAVSSGKDFDETRLESVGLSAHQMKEMYRLLSIAKYDDRYVIPKSHREQYVDPYHAQGMAGFDMGNNVSYTGMENSNISNNSQMSFSSGCGDGCGCSVSPESTAPDMGLPDLKALYGGVVNEAFGANPQMSNSSGCGDGCGCSISPDSTSPSTAIPKLKELINKTGKQIYEENFYGGIWRD